MRLLRMIGSGLAAVTMLTGGILAETLQPEHWLDWERAGAAQISPDGNTIVYTRSRVDQMNDRWASEIWMMNADGSKQRFLTKGRGVRWSPDGTRIAYIADGHCKTDGHCKKEGAQIFVRWMDAEGATSQVTHVRHAPRMLRWSPDGTRIAFRARVPAQSEWTVKIATPPKGAEWNRNATVIDTLHYRQDRVGMIKGFDHLFVVTADGGTARALTEGRWHTSARFSGTVQSSPFAWTPDGSHIVFDGNGPDGATDEAALSSHIHKINVNSGDITQLTSTPGFWASPALSPDGETVVYGGKVETISTYGPDQIRRISVNGGTETVITADLPAGAANFLFTRRNDRVYFSLNAEGTTQIMRLNMNGRMEAVTSGNHRLSLDSITSDGAFAGRGTNPSHDFDIVTGTVTRGRLSRLTDLNADILEDVTLGNVEEFWTDSSDNTRVQGWVVTPPGFDPDKKYPMLLYIHGGPHAMYGVNFNFVFQAMAAKGYVVVFTNPRGSTGYGAAFANAIDNAYPGRRDFDDLMAGVDAVVSRGYVDEDHMYVTGCSGGGVLTTWVVGNTDRFAAGAALCPVINWVSFSGTADIVAWSYKRFHKPWWEDMETWLKHSPLMRAPHITTPTLFMTGDKDLRTPLAQAEEMYSALKMLDVPTKLVVMHGEYHGTTRIPSNMLRTIAILDKWFKEWPEAGGAERE
ncbi:S9 family peptidase [Eilatimonas milleporae]|uniref:Dipeptidyl aminopeptidase/acylaminoacyl peptidase n=1 Tax=Eilatimonas milleporae TaxID=911205 RepID=A0A3M0CPS4_9PROT|nr:S9 family peptidase [Eilatimonas milleporae]RMB08869.1 dipeptidyl aminopeptidase/acylaminoacyl peptidase [Eilatimonas milleporae]